MNCGALGGQRVIQYLINQILWLEAHVLKKV